MKLTAVYPISANPPTNGHADILVRSATKFEHVYWIAARNILKELFFSDEERIKMMQMYVEHHNLRNVTVESFDHAIMRYAKVRGASFLVRGLRNTTDFQLEIEMASANRMINQEIETICFLSQPDYAMMSSSIVRELARLHEGFGKYVIPPVEEFIKKKIGW